MSIANIVTITFSAASIVVSTVAIRLSGKARRTAESVLPPA